MDLTNWQNVDLLAMIEADTQLKRVSGKDGGEYAGPCPFCGGTDRFHVWPDHPDGPRWRCFDHRAGRNGCGRGGDLLAYLVERGDVTPQEAGRLRRNGAPWNGDAARPLQRPRRDAPGQRSPVCAPLADTPPPVLWQEQARHFVGYCHDLLFTDAGRVGLDYLHRRGLSDEAIRAWRLGWHEKTRQRPAQRWGLQGKPVWLLRGVVIPWTVEGAIWHVKIRRFEGERPVSEAGKKYAQITGGNPTLFGLDRLAGGRTAIICEAELDAVLLWQKAGDLADVVAIGTKGKKVSLSYLVHLAGATTWLVALDNDADIEARQWGQFSDRVRRLRPPAGNDITDYYQAGGDLRAWVSYHLAQNNEATPDVDPLVLWAIAKLGAVVTTSGG